MSLNIFKSLVKRKRNLDICIKCRVEPVMKSYNHDKVVSSLDVCIKCFGEIINKPYMTLEEEE